MNSFPEPRIWLRSRSPECGAKSILDCLQDDLPTSGDWVLIHVGFAMSKISEQDALDQMNTLRILGEDEQAMQEVRGYGLDNFEDRKPS